MKQQGIVHLLTPIMNDQTREADASSGLVCQARGPRSGCIFGGGIAHVLMHATNNEKASANG